VPHGDPDDCELRASLRAEGLTRENFAQVFVRTRAFLYRFLRRRLRNEHDSDDALAITFMKFRQTFAAYDPAKPLDAWLFGIARNVRRQLSKRADQRRVLIRIDAELSAAEFGESQSQLPGPSELVADTDMCAALLRAVACLKPPGGDFLKARFFEGRSVKEIADSHRTSEQTVRNHIEQAVEFLRGRLGGGAS
jgi:RNA polymerase sigma factor (sigma-70 family)